MNGHFSAVGEAPGAGSYEHGVQVIVADKEFKYVERTIPLSASLFIMTPF